MGYDPSSSSQRNWSRPLAEDAYIQRRLAPGLWDNDHVPLRDLLTAVRHFAFHAHGNLFDYGCGGTPYREVFAHCESYIGADIVPGPRVDRELSPSGNTSEADESYDTVFSSQVLEHVASPEVYLAEAWRILKPGGALILTTHGMFLEHGCPSDFYRWTGYGLKQEVERAGFEAEEIIKITPGTRGSIYLIHLAVETATPRRNFFTRASVAGVRRIWKWFFRPVVNLLADLLEPRQIIAGDAPESVYIGVGILARKPVAISDSR